MRIVKRDSCLLVYRNYSLVVSLRRETVEDRKGDCVGVALFGRFLSFFKEVGLLFVIF